MSLTVLEAGPLSLVVDLGRPHHRSLGVPLGGAADRASFLQGNALVGNDSSCAALEFAAVGPTLRAECEMGCALFGAPFEAWIDGKPIPMGITFNVSSGSTLRIGPAHHGMRGYVCVVGGIQSTIVLESRSAWEPLRRHDVLPCRGSCVAARTWTDPIQSYGDKEHVAMLRCLPGPQWDWFESMALASCEFCVSPQCDRMGLRLLGQPLSMPQREMTSEPVCPGSVQVVNDGQCVILGVDSQTIGGYPKIAQIIAADLDRIGQLRIGQRLRFQFVSMADAEVLFLRQSQQLARRLQLAPT